jgi:hypothetical protein
MATYDAKIIEDDDDAPYAALQSGKEGAAGRNASYDEKFAPAFESESRQGTVTTSIFGLVSTILGGGVLSLPYAFSQSGLLLGLVILVVVALAADYSIFTLAACSRRGNAHTYEDVAFLAFGPKGRIVSMCMVISITYLVCVCVVASSMPRLSP